MESNARGPVDRGSVQKKKEYSFFSGCRERSGVCVRVLERDVLRGEEKKKSEAVEKVVGAKKGSSRRRKREGQVCMCSTRRPKSSKNTGPQLVNKEMRGTPQRTQDSMYSSIERWSTTLRAYCLFEELRAACRTKCP